ncbi:unnamed protein product [Discosporangium mesarthrocarpum]
MSTSNRMRTTTTPYWVRCEFKQVISRMSISDNEHPCTIVRSTPKDSPLPPTRAQEVQVVKIVYSSVMNPKLTSTKALSEQVRYTTGAPTLHLACSVAGSGERTMQCLMHQLGQNFVGID